MSRGSAALEVGVGDLDEFESGFGCEPRAQAFDFGQLGLGMRSDDLIHPSVTRVLNRVEGRFTGHVGVASEFDRSRITSGTLPAPVVTPTRRASGGPNGQIRTLEGATSRRRSANSWRGVGDSGTQIRPQGRPSTDANGASIRSSSRCATAVGVPNGTASSGR